MTRQKGPRERVDVVIQRYSLCLDAVIEFRNGKLAEKFCTRFNDSIRAFYEENPKSSAKNCWINGVPPRAYVRITEVFGQKRYKNPMEWAKSFLRNPQQPPDEKGSA